MEPRLPMRAVAPWSSHETTTRNHNTHPAGLIKAVRRIRKASPIEGFLLERAEQNMENVEVADLSVRRFGR